MVVKVQLYHLGSVRQWDDHQCGINIFVVADEWTESAGLVGEQVVCGQYVFLVCVKSQVLMRSDYFCCVALDQIATEEPFSLRETPPEGFAPSPKERLGH